MTKQQKYVPSNIKGFEACAGMNSKVDKDNYYWFQVAEFGASLSTFNSKIQINAETGETVLSFDVDIMDGKGEKSIYADEQGNAKNLRGLILSAVFSISKLQELADAIRKGGMSVRLTGRPNELISTSRKSGEEYKGVDITDVYSAGNDIGNMVIHYFEGMERKTIDSKKIADAIQSLVDFYYSKKTVNA